VKTGLSEDLSSVEQALLPATAGSVEEAVKTARSTVGDVDLLTVICHSEQSERLLLRVAPPVVRARDLDPSLRDRG
jgi:hypothetical protein